MIQKSKWFAGAGALLAAALLAQSAWSDKPAKIAELETKVAAAKASIKGDCGCDIPIVVKYDTYKSEDEMARVDVTLGSLTKAAKGRCDKPADKQAVCSKVSGVELTNTESATDVPKVDGKTLKLYCGVHTANSQGQISKVLGTL